jgi:hypothetical protein
LVVLAVVGAVPFGLAFAYESAVAPYLALIAFAPAMYIIRRLPAARDVTLFALTSSSLTVAMATYWLPAAVTDMFAASVLASMLLSVLAWLSWCGANTLFLIAYRYGHARHLLPVACLGVVLFNHWPSVFGVNPFAALMHADGLSGSAFFIGTAAVEGLAILFSAWVTQALLSVRFWCLCRAFLMGLVLWGLDAAAGWQLASVPSRGLNVALVQAGNVYSQKLSSASEIESFVQEIVEAPGPRADLVVFPESVFSFNFADDDTSADAAIEALKRFSAQQDVAFLLSAVQAPADDGLAEAGRAAGTRISSLLINQGQLQGYADKARTIPFAEYTPAWAVAPLRWLGATVESRAAAYGYQQGTVRGVRIIPLSCFESLDQAVVEARLHGRPGLLVSQSNLDSFGEPGSATYRAALWGHMAQEQRWVNQWQVPVVRAVKSGGSTQVNAYGHLDQALLQQSWGEEWVSTRVGVPEFTVLNVALAWLRQCLNWLIAAVAVGGMVQWALRYLRRKPMPGRAR